MKFTEAQNNRRKAFVVNLFSRNSSLTNAEVYEKVLKRYGAGMVSGRISEFRKLAARASTATYPVQMTARLSPKRQEALRAEHIKKYGTKKASKPVAETEQDASPQKAVSLPEEIQNALGALKAGIESHYRTGDLSLNFDGAGHVLVKFEFEPRTPTKGEVLL